MRLKEGVAATATALAIAIPMLVVHWVALGHGIFAQIVSVGLWGLAIIAWCWAAPAAAAPWRALRPLLLALALVAGGIIASALAHKAPAGVWAGSLGVVVAAVAVAVTASMAARREPELATRVLMWGLLAAAGASLLIATLQLAAPGWGSSLLIAPARTPGRASANLVHPNHLATLLLWAWLAVAVWPSQRAMRAPARQGAAGTLVPSAGPFAFMLAFALQAGVVATSSRAGLVAALLLAMWAALDRRLPRQSAWLLWITALGGLAVTLGRVLVAPAASLGAADSLVRPGARSGVFLDTLELIGEHPFAGVGWMEFQLAWSLSPLGDRGPRYFEHPHNIVLHLVAELGLPLGIAICAALIWGAVALLRSLPRVAPAWQPRGLMLAAMLATAGVHSLFDAPFWYAHLLLPAAWMWGCLVGLEVTEVPNPAAKPGKARALDPPARLAPVAAACLAAGAALVASATWAWADFRKLHFEGLGASARAAAPAAAHPAGAGTDTESRLWGYYADHRQALRGADTAPDLFRRAQWAAIDTALLAAWIAALERAGRHDEARYLMQRAMEFRDPAFGPWLAECRVVPPLEPPSRCKPPAKAPGWRDFR